VAGLLEEVVAADPATPGEFITLVQVAELLHTDPATVTRLTTEGKLVEVRAPGGRSRYVRSAVQVWMDGLPPDQVTVPSPRRYRTGGPTADPDRQAAAAVVSEAVALAMDAASAEAAEAVLVTAAVVTAAADRAAEAAASARKARAVTAKAAAESMTRRALRTAVRVRSRADAAAAQVQLAAALAADELTHPIADGATLDAGRLAILLDATVRAAADATAQDTERAAEIVRTAAATSAAQTAQKTALAARVMELEVAGAAEVQRQLASLTATQVALDTDARAARVARAAQDAAEALLNAERRATTSETVTELDQESPAPTSVVANVKMLEVALRESNNRFQFLVDAVTDYAIMTLTPEGLIASWNTGAERLKGYTPQEVLGRHFSIFYTAEDRDTGLPQRLLDLARAEGSHEDTGWRVRKDGTPFWGDIIISAVHDDTGMLTGFVKVTRDLTEQHRLEIAQDSFYYAFEHDFRVPITAIKGFAELIRSADPHDQKYLAARVDSNANRLLGMVEELVDYARLRSGLVPINLQIVDMLPLARIAVANLAAIAETSRVKVAGGTSVRVLADPAALERVIANLVMNALKYSPSDSSVDLVCEQGHGMGALRIVDQGRGIDGRDLNAIFLEFERGRLAQDDSGTGLGLASVQRLVDLQHGTVEITSQIHVGTTVTIELPLER
jgi:PAS domain S-box-containing protein